MRTTADNERMTISLALERARRMSEQLERVVQGGDGDPSEAFPLRLAYAHALGLIDQLGALVESDPR